MPEIGALMDEQFGPVLRNIASSYQTRLTLDLLGRPARQTGLFAGIFQSPKLGNYDVVYDPDNPEQIVAGQVLSKDGRVYFDDWTNFPALSSRKDPAPRRLDLDVSDYRIDATINPDLSYDRSHARKGEAPRGAARRRAVRGSRRRITVTSATVDGRPAEVLQPESPRSNLASRGNNIFLVVPAEPLAAGREYEFEFHHEGKVILDAGDGVYYVTARGAWYPMHGLQFATFDLTFHYPRAYDLVAPGDVVG